MPRSNHNFPLTYQESLDYIASLEARGWRLGLDRMEEFVRRAGLTDAIGAPGGPQFIHVAGTNGKGSTTAFLQSLLVEHGFNTGAFFSPFVVDPRERIQQNRHLISKNAMARLTTFLAPIGESLADTAYEGVTEFEFKAALAFLLWKRKKCDWVALEVGLGGRLDATNVVTPRACIITSISRDHMSILGDTIAAIALEKAGIIKQGVPVIVGNLPPDAMRVVRVVAEERGAPVLSPSQFDVPELGITGTKQHLNLNMACTAMAAAGIELRADAIDRGARLATIPGRFQVEKLLGRDLVLDGAHNAESAEVLLETLAVRYPGKRVVLVSNVLRGHDLMEFYGPLKSMVDAVHVVPIDSPRARPSPETASELKGFAPVVEAHEDLVAGIREAVSSASEEQIVVVTGSYYLIGDALRSPLFR